MEIRQLRYFVAVAEELNFSKAAIRLHMSQPPLSHQIKLLEEELGLVLLQRDKRSVRLTPPGLVYLSECRAVLDRLQAATSRARHLALGTAGSLRVGLATSAVDQVMPGLLAQLRQQRSLADVTFTDMGSEEQVRALAHDRLDLGFIHARIPVKGLRRQTVHSEGFAVVLPRAHPLAGRAKFRLAELAGEPMVSFSREQRSALFDTLVAVCMNAGFSPRLVHVARHPMSMFQMVRHGLGVCIVPSSYATAVGDELHVHHLPLSVGALQLDAVWNPDNPSELLRYVVEHLLPSDSARSEAMAKA